ncbi:glycosyltransferase family 4 protein [Methylomicrobium sp. RS1]|uniref:glycosyltransferase family 4 protein n=1 Tax=Candidatus Methylomicrobium oryzae TaxID=2802053 RepID=UPI001921D5D1|nr:glycosyltransferase family 4 protein [Methylomicrobium sp. RS1]MBL1264890.1 glycosyltransferase family 4 protein [Methylomicrobium sp. RS1]
MMISLSRWLITLGLAAQRFNIRLPKKVKVFLRSLLARLTKDEIVSQGIEDWSTPLFARQEAVFNQASSLPLEDDIGYFAAGKPLQTAYGVSRPLAKGNEAAPRLRCLLVTDSLDVGGMDEVVVFLARGLPRHGVGTAVLHASINGTPDAVPTGRLGRLLLEQGVEAVELAGADGAKWLEAWRPDVISAHCAPPWVLETATQLKIPYVDTLHGAFNLFYMDSAAENERGRQLAGIVAVSDLIRRQYLHRNPSFSPDRIATIPNGVDEERRIPRSRNSARARFGIRDEFIFVSLGRHCLQKNAYGLVTGFADVAARYPEAHLVIAGRVDDAAYFAQVQRLRDRLPCRDRIHLRDHFSDPAELLAAADGFVLDSFFEGWSLASMEALYSGIPVVLSDVGGAFEQVGYGEERGYLIPNPLGDPLRVNWETMRDARFVSQVNREALVDAMSSLIENRAFFFNARERLISESAARFHPDVCLQSHARILMAAASGDLTRKQSITHCQTT